LIFWPACSDCASTSGFSASIRSSGTPVFSAIAESTSPSWTTYVRRVALVVVVVVVACATVRVVRVVWVAAGAAPLSSELPPPDETTTISATTAPTSATGASQRAVLEEAIRVARIRSP
jgi:hypothetical protein